MNGLNWFCNTSILPFVRFGSLLFPKNVLASSNPPGGGVGGGEGAGVTFSLGGRKELLRLILIKMRNLKQKSFSILKSFGLLEKKNFLLY